MDTLRNRIFLSLSLSLSHCLTLYMYKINSEFLWTRGKTRASKLSHIVKARKTAEEEEEEEEVYINMKTTKILVATLKAWKSRGLMLLELMFQGASNCCLSS